MWIHSGRRQLGSLLLGKTPGAFLAGLGALPLGMLCSGHDTRFVAGIRPFGGDMLHVGDWIVVPSTIANGIVTDVADVVGGESGTMPW